MEKDEITQEQLNECEENAIIKYEKNAKPYRKQYKSVPKQITCQKCGAVYNLRKIHYEGQDYWFCKNCIIEKARQLSKRK